MFDSGHARRFGVLVFRGSQSYEIPKREGDGEVSIALIGYDLRY